MPIGSPPIFPYDVLQWYEWVWLVYVGIGWVCIDLYVLIMFVEAKGWKRVVWMGVGLLSTLPCVVVAFVPIELWNTHPKMVAYVNHF